MAQAPPTDAPPAVLLARSADSLSEPSAISAKLGRFSTLAYLFMAEI